MGIENGQNEKKIKTKFDPKNLRRNFIKNIKKKFFQSRAPTVLHKIKKK